MKRLILLLFCFSKSSAQMDANWVIGYPNQPTQNIIFNGNNPPIIISKSSSIPLDYTNTVISDSNGNLISFSNGINIYDSSYNIMQGGSGLSPSQFTTSNQNFGLPMTQAAFFLPAPGYSHKYYLFHETGDFSTFQGIAGYYPDKLYYSTLDASLNNGLGGVTSINNVILNDSLEFGNLTAVKHANGRDWWIVCKRYYRNIFYTFLLTPSGLSGPFSQQIGPDNVYWGSGEANFSPDGEWFVFMGQIKRASLFHFDRCTGLLSNYNDLLFPDSAAYSMGASFSYSSRYLYLITQFHIYQYDLLISPVNASKTLVATYDGFQYPAGGSSTLFTISQLALDNKIYISCWNSHPFLHVINSPDSAGILSDVQQHSFLLPIPSLSMSLSPNYTLGRLVGSSCDTITGLNEASVPLSMTIRISPNPAKDLFWLNYDITNQPGNAELVIYNTLGEMVLRKTLYNYFKTSKIDCSNFSEGIYYLSVTSNQRRIASAKFVKE